MSGMEGLQRDRAVVFFIYSICIREIGGRKNIRRKGGILRFW